MVKIVKREVLEGGRKILYQCEECGLHYSNEEDAASCEDWCMTHKSCNLEIIKKSIENNPK